MNREVSIRAPMRLIAAPDANALWVGLLELEDVSGADGLRLIGAQGIRACRLLVRSAGRVLGYVNAPVVNGAVELSVLEPALAQLGEAPDFSPERVRPPITVAICTRDRTALLRESLEGVLALTYPSFDVLIVDNAPRTDATRRLVEEEYAGRGVRYTRASVAGLSRARNAALAQARHDLVAFTDDDVVVDRHWLEAIARGFARNHDIACVTGLVASGELATAAQRHFDARVSWSKILTPRQFRRSAPPSDLPMFPFCVGEFGTGANFAVDRHRISELGGFDEALGVGTRTMGGEDIDLFVRVLFADQGLAVEPDAVVWHRHREDVEELRIQAVGYGRGLGAWLGKVAMNPQMASVAAQRAPWAIARLLRNSGTAVDGADVVHRVDVGERFRAIDRLELRSILGGPLAYMRERRR